MVDVNDVLSGLSDAAGGTGWGGAAVALFAGDPAPAIALAAAEIIGRLFGPRPTKHYCTHDKNPLRITRGPLPMFEKGRDSRGTPPIGAGKWWQLNSDPQWDRVQVEMSYFPASGLFDCQEDSNPPPSARYPWPRWRQLVANYDLSPLKVTWSKSIFAEGVYMLGWAMLTEDEAQRRYKAEVTPVLNLALAQGLSPEDIGKLEAGYQGRVIDGAWHWPEEVILGRPIAKLPSWLPLDSGVRDLAAILLYLHDCGLSSRELELLRDVDPGAGRPLAELPTAKRREAFALAVVLAAVRSRGNAAAWTQAKAGLADVARSLALNPTADDLKGAAAKLCNLWRAVAPRSPTTAAEVAQFASVYQSPASVLPWLLGAGILALAAGWAYSNRATLARKLKGKRRWNRPPLFGRQRRSR